MAGPKGLIARLARLAMMEYDLTILQSGLRNFRGRLEK